MTTQYRIFAHNGQITAIAFDKEHVHPVGVEVESGEAEDIREFLAGKAPAGVGSPWPPAAAKSARDGTAVKTRAKKE